MSLLILTYDCFVFLQELCKELHHKIDVLDEARYDIEFKVARNEQEVQQNKVTKMLRHSLTYFDGFCFFYNIDDLCTDPVTESENRWAEGNEKAQLEAGKENYR